MKPIKKSESFAQDRLFPAKRSMMNNESSKKLIVEYGGKNMSIAQSLMKQQLAELQQERKRQAEVVRLLERDLQKQRRQETQFLDKIEIL